MKTNKYLEYVNGKFTIQEVTNYHKKNSLFIQFLSNITIGPKISPLANNTFKLIIYNGLEKIISLFLVRPSGIQNNQKKRIQILTNQFYRDDIEPISIYPSGDKTCYIKFGNNSFLNNKDKKTRSIWIDFSLIVMCLKSNINIKYFFKGRDESYYIYFSTNPKDLFNDVNYIEVFNNHLRELNNLINKTFGRDVDNSLSINEKKLKTKETNIFKWKSNLSKSIKHKYDDKKDEVGRKAEEFFNLKLKNNDISILEKLGIGVIEEYVWVNENKESYRPYDFYINNEIYIDVKGTFDSKIYFNLSDNEKEFSNEIIEKGYKYFVVNVYNMIDEYNKQIKVIPFEDIDKYYFDVKQTYVYKEGMNNENKG